MPPDPFQPLADELSSLAAAGRIARFWLRDDDAVEPTAELARLFDLTRQAAVQLTLAVIPQPSGHALARKVAGARHVTAVVHGWMHANHAPEGVKKQEFGPHRPLLAMLGDLEKAEHRLAMLQEGHFYPLFVPPWNRMDASLLPHLADIGYRAVSAFGSETASPLPMVNSTVDLMDWHGTRGGREPAALVTEIVGQLRAAPGRPIGILAHHLVHDETAWTFLSNLFSVTAQSRACRWCGIAELVDDWLQPDLGL